MAIPTQSIPQQEPTAPPHSACAFDAATTSWSCWHEGPVDDAAAARELELLRLTSEHFRQDISSWWGHATFYTVLEGALATVFATTVGPRDGGDPLLTPRTLAVVLSTIGLLFSVMWLLSALGRRALIGAWRNEVLHHEGLVDRVHRSYGRVEHLATTMRNEPTTVTLAVPLAAACGWGAALLWGVGWAR